MVDLSDLRLVNTGMITTDAYRNLDSWLGQAKQRGDVNW